MKPNASASCLILSPFDENALQQAIVDSLNKLGNNPDLVIVAASSDYREHLKEVIELLQIYGHATRIAGGSSNGLFGVGKSAENVSGISLLFLSLPNTGITRRSDCLPGIGSDANAGSLFIGNPARDSTGAPDMNSLIQSLNTNQSPANAVGGLLTGGPDIDDLFLFTESGESRASFLLLEFNGGVRLVPFVSQSCRPIGSPLIITEADDTEVIKIARREAFSVLEETVEELDLDERMQADGNIFAGLATTESIDEFDTGDFLIRPIVGASLSDGRIKLTSPARPGQTIQFQMRDPEIAERDLRRQLGDIHRDYGSPFAGVLFGGSNRGTRLYDECDRDPAVLEEELNAFPLTGFFTHREIGPVAGTLHSHDQSLCGCLFYDE